VSRRFWPLHPVKSCRREPQQQSLINIDIVRTNMLFFVFNPGDIKFEKK
jgi:hypothetical protein